MNIISISKIVELNKLLLENGINIKIHISDACGKQSMWIEPLDSQPVEENVYACFTSHTADTGLGSAGGSGGAFDPQDRQG